MIYLRTLQGFKDVAIVKRVGQSEFLRKSFVLVSGSAIAQFIPVITAPIITRLYSPESYGLLGLYMMVSSIFGLFATLQLQHAIIQEKEDDEAFAVIELCIVLSVCIALLSAVPVIFFSTEISSYLHSVLLEKWLIFIPFSILLTGWNSCDQRSSALRSYCR